MWKKVLLGTVAVIAVIIALAVFFTSSITDVANKQLDALRKGDIVIAYSYTSKDFQSHTTLAGFTSFVNKYPALKNNQKSSWSERSINNNIGTLKGSLTAINGAVTPIEYQFVKENHEWKILGILPNQIGAFTKPVSEIKPSVPADVSQGEIYQVLVSDAINADGGISNSKLVMPPNAPKVFAVVYILHAKVGLKVTAELVREANEAKIGPVEAIVSQAGNIFRSFSFTNTAPSWPAGNYRINVSTSNNQVASVNFKIQATHPNKKSRHSRHRRRS